jgi:simple sugar transport system permease protein
MPAPLPTPRSISRLDAGGAPTWSRLAWPLLALAALLLFNGFFTPGFLSLTIRDGRLFGSLVDVLNRAAPAALAAIGMTLVIATGGVDLSVGAVMAIAGSIAALMVAQAHARAPMILASALGVGILCGAWNGMLVAIFRVQPIVATLLLMVAGRGIAQLLTEGQIITFRNPALEFIGGGYFLGLPFAVTVVVVALLVTAALMRLTALGLFVESVGDNETASRFAGINDRFVKFAVYTFCGLCAGAGGLIIAGNIRAADANNAGLYLELDAILAVVIGGTALTGGRFYLLSTVIGALIIQTLTTTILTRGIPVQWTLVVKAIVVLGVCLLQAPRIQRTLSSLWKQLRPARRRTP